jgi:multidrug resistance protein, MATE family
MRDRPGGGRSDGYGGIMRMALPLMAAAAITPLLSFVDAWAIRIQPEPHHLGAIGVGTMLFNYVLWGFVFLRFATVGLAAQAIGAGDAAEERRVVLRGVVLAVGMAIFVVAATLLFLDVAVGVFASSPAVEEEARLYVLIRIWSLPAAFANYVFLGWLLARRRMALSFLLEGVRALAWVVLVVGLVRGLDWGIAGVALGATAAEWIGLAATMVAVRREWATTAGRGWAGVIRWTAFRRILAISSDLFIRTQCLLVAFLGFTAAGATFGDVTLAANALLMNLYLLLAYVLGGFGQVVSTLVGHAVGAHDGVTLRNAIRRTFVVALASGAVLCVASVLAGPVLIDVLTDIEGIRDEARRYLPYVAALAVLSVGAFQFDGTAIGATRTAMLRNALIASMAVYGVLHLTLPGLIGNHGTWVAFTAFMAARSIAYVLVLPMLRRAAD